MTESIAEPSAAAAESNGSSSPVHVAKRVRFATGVCANDVVHLSIVSDANHVTQSTEINAFAPAFTYHAFGKQEEIEGYDGLRIDVRFNAFDFTALLEIVYEQQHPRADDLLEKLTLSLPAGFAQTHDKDRFLDNLRETSTAFTPPGECSGAYSRHVDGAERVFEIYACKLEDNAPAQKLLTNLQTLALWFIEGADAVDVTDPRWVLYLIYERIPSASASGGSAPRGYEPVGYITLFKFRNPLGRKLGNTLAMETHRICQALVFPNYQRQGHCEQLVEHIYTQVQNDANVYEVTVEDPVPGFAKLRDLVDARQCMQHHFFSLAPRASKDAPSAVGTAALTRADIQAVQETLKLTQRQVQRCYELLKLSVIDTTDDEQAKCFRLEVKKRLFKLHTEDLEAMGSADRRKAFLEAEFRRLEAHYTALLAKLKLPAACTTSASSATTSTSTASASLAPSS